MPASRPFQQLTNSTLTHQQIQQNHQKNNFYPNLPHTPNYFQIILTLNIIASFIIIQKMIKHNFIPTKDAPQKIEEIDGPPLDYSFKNIRVLSQLISFNPAQGKPSQSQQKPQQLVGHLSSQKQLGQSAGQAKLNIIRTIDVNGSKDEMLKQFVNKKVEKTAVKVVKKTQIKTTSLFLRYNKIIHLNGFSEILHQILPNNKWMQLIWIDLSHNRLTNISKEIQNLPQLKNLYLHVNFISNFKEFQNLQAAKLLRTFTIHGNPIQNYPQFRCLLTAILPQLQKIDSALLTKRQKQRGQIIKKQGGKYPVIQNPQKPPEESEEEEDN